MDFELVANYIIDWLRDQLKKTKQKGFVIGVSGGVDSAVTSTLCARSGLPVFCLNMPIHQAFDQYDLSEVHISWLTSKYENVGAHIIDLTETYDTLKNALLDLTINDLALANIRSRLRMVTLYAFANSNNYLVVGTGNKVEDYGIGFFTKYGDGGVDISPIGDLLKSEVYQLAEYLGILDSIREAEPNDGLWDDGRTDESQIGATYDEIEWAMNYCERKDKASFDGLSKRHKEVLHVYLSQHKVNKHKVLTIPVCDLSSIRPLFG